MRSITGDKDTVFEIMLREQKPLHPFRTMQHLVLDRRADCFLEQRRHILVFVDDGVNGEMPARVLDDEQRPVIVDTIVVARTWCFHLVVEFRTVEQRLAHFAQMPVAVLLEAKLLAHHARSAVAADHVLRTDFGPLAVRFPDMRNDAIGILRERFQFVAKLHINVRNHLRRPDLSSGSSVYWEIT